MPEEPPVPPSLRKLYDAARQLAAIRIRRHLLEATVVGLDHLQAVTKRSDGKPKALFDPKRATGEEFGQFLIGLNSVESDWLGVVFAVWNDMMIDHRQAGDQDIVAELGTRYSPATVSRIEPAVRRVVATLREMGFTPRGVPPRCPEYVPIADRDRSKDPGIGRRELE
jgi:hypothetical protein